MGTLCSYIERDLGDLIVEAQAAVQNDLALGEIVCRFEPLTKSIGARLAAGRPHRDDVENVARYALTRAIQRHTGPIETFPAYAKRYMSGAAYRELGRWLPPTNAVTLPIEEVPERAIVMSVSVEDVLEHHGWGGGDTAAAIATLRPIQQHLLRLRYMEDADLAEMAAEADTSVSAVSQRLSTVHRQLRTTLAA